MTFIEIEKVIGGALPASQKYPAWWSNNPSNNVMTKFWLDAGFVTEQVDVERRRLVFRRVRTIAAPGSVLATQSDTAEPSGSHVAVHPLFGALKGTVRISSGVDLTEPADPEWGASSGV